MTAVAQVAAERIPGASMTATLAGAALLALAGTAGITYAVLAVALGGFVISFGLPPVVGASNLPRSTFVLALATLLAGAAVLLVETNPPLRLLPVAVAVSVIAMFLVQLTRADNRPRLSDCLAGDALGIGLITSGMALAPLAQARPDQHLLAAAMAATALSSLLDPLVARPRSHEWLLPAAALLGAAGALAVGAVAATAPVWTCAVTGAVSGAVAHALRRILADRAAPGERGDLTIAAAGLLAPGLAVFTIARLFLG